MTADPEHLAALFNEEALELATVLEQGLVALEQARDPASREAVVAELFRAAHTLKGAAQATGATTVAVLGHELEDQLDALRQESGIVDEALIDGLLSRVDAVRLQLDPSDGGASGPAVRGAGRPAPSMVAAGTVRVDAQKLDRLGQGASELLRARERVADLAERTAALVDSAPRRRLSAAWQTVLQELDTIEAQAITVERELHHAGEALQASVRELRMLPFSHVTGVLARAARDVARSVGKKVELDIAGGDVELDSAVLGPLREPLLHLVRNAVSHGVELPADRQAVGKSAAGRITVSAALQGGQVEIAVRDDGAGVDLGAIGEVARRQGVELPDDAAVQQLLFSPGFSTVAVPGSVSGRGVGLDAVRTTVEGIAGSVNLETWPGAGTRVLLSVPLTRSALHVLVVEAGGETLALPSTSLARIIRIAPADLGAVRGRQVVILEGRPVPVLDLAALLGFTAVPLTGGLLGVVVRSAGVDAVLVISGLIDERVVTVQGLGRRMGGLDEILGATVLPEGEVSLVLNPAAWVRVGLEAESPRVGLSSEDGQPPEAPLRVLLAEDSVTTRSLERGILEAAGYEVLVASDGREAWEKLQAHGADVVVSDVTMPGMDGFVLCQTIRRSRRFRDLPVVLVTSLASEQDRRRGVEAGANAYFTKSAFDQGSLLDAIARLV